MRRPNVGTEVAMREALRRAKIAASRGISSASAAAADGAAAAAAAQAAVAELASLVAYATDSRLSDDRVALAIRGAAGALLIVPSDPAPGDVLTALSSSSLGWAAPATGASGPAGELATAGAAVVVSAATPPTTGQVLTATSPTTADWQTPAAGAAADFTLNDWIGW